MTRCWFLMRLGRGDETWRFRSHLAPSQIWTIDQPETWKMQITEYFLFRFIFYSTDVSNGGWGRYVVFAFCFLFRFRFFCKGNSVETIKKETNIVETRQDQMSNIQRQSHMFTKSLQLSRDVRHVWWHNVHFCLICQEEIMNKRHKHWFIYFQKNKNWIAFSFSDWWWQVYTASAPHKMFRGPGRSGNESSSLHSPHESSSA